MSVRFLIAPVLTGLLLTGMAFSLERREPSEAVLRFHKQVREAAAEIPQFIGPWYGEETEVPSAATRVLKPNVMVSRRYRNVRTGEEVTLLLVHTDDANNLVFHYPPVCYPYNGWNQVWEKEREWQLAGQTRPMAKYCFERSDFQRRDRIVIHNFMILPTGIFVGMDELRRAANRPSSRFLGAAQLQILFDAGVPRERRKEVSDRLIEACRRVIERILRGKRSDS